MEQNTNNKRINRYIEIYSFHTHIKRKGICLLYNNFPYLVFNLLHDNFIYNNDSSNT